MAVVGESVTEACYLRSFLSGFTPRASLKWSDHARANKKWPDNYAQERLVEEVRCGQTKPNFSFVKLKTRNRLINLVDHACSLIEINRSFPW